jgi:hypothetical protein
MEALEFAPLAATDMEDGNQQRGSAQAAKREPLFAVVESPLWRRRGCLFLRRHESPTGGSAEAPSCCDVEAPFCAGANPQPVAAREGIPAPHKTTAQVDEPAEREALRARSASDHKGN